MFGLVAQSVGAVPSASFPFVWVSAVAVAFVALANGVAAGPPPRSAPLLTAE